MNTLVKLAVVACAGMMLTMLVLQGQPTYLGAAVFVILLPVFFVRPYYYFVFFILVRPIVDLSLRGNLPGNKLSAVLVFPLIFFCVKDMFLDAQKRRVLFERSVLSKINVLFFFLFATYFASFAYSKDAVISTMDLIRHVAMLVVINYTTVIFSVNEAKRDTFINILLLSSLAPLLFGLKQLITHTGVQETGFNRIYGTFAHPNVYAEYLVLIIFLSFSAFSRAAKKTKARTLSGFLLGLCLLSLCFTYTRTIWIAFAVSILVYILLKRGSSKKIIYLGFILLVVGASFSQIKSRFGDVTGQTSHESRSSWQWRMELWQDTIGDLKRHPIVGNGLGMFEHDKGAMAHNDYLRLAYEAGIPSAIITFILFSFMFFYAVAASRKASDKEQDYYNIAAALVTALFIGSLAVNTLRNTTIMVYYMSVIILFIQGSTRKTIYEGTSRQ